MTRRRNAPCALLCASVVYIMRVIQSVRAGARLIKLSMCNITADSYLRFHRRRNANRRDRKEKSRKLENLIWRCARINR